MSLDDIQNLIKQIKILSPKEKGLLFSMFFVEESKEKTIQRKDLFGSVKLDKEITDEDIKVIW